MKKVTSILLAMVMLLTLVPTVALAETYVAQVFNADNTTIGANDGQYETIEAAVEALNANGSKGTIKLLANCTASAGLTFGTSTATSTDIVVDLNGKTLTLADDEGNTTYGSVLFKKGVLNLPAGKIKDNRATIYAVFNIKMGATSGAQTFAMNDVVFNMPELAIRRSVFSPEESWTGTIELTNSKVTSTKGSNSSDKDQTIIFGNTDHSHLINAPIKLSIVRSDFEIADATYFIVNLAGNYNKPTKTKERGYYEEGTVELVDSTIDVKNVGTYFSNGGMYTYNMKSSHILVEGNTSDKGCVCNYLRLVMDKDSSFIAQKGTAPGAKFWGESIIPEGARVEFSSGTVGQGAAVTLSSDKYAAIEDPDIEGGKAARLILNSGSNFVVNGSVLVENTLTVNEGANLTIEGDLKVAKKDPVNVLSPSIVVNSDANVKVKGELGVGESDPKTEISLAAGYYKNEVADAFVADGYMCVATPEDDLNHVDYPFVIKKKPPVAQVGLATYTSLVTAVNEAKTGDTIKLLADCTLTETLQIKTAGVTLDLGGKTISPASTGTSFSSATGNAMLAVCRGADLTIKNGTLTAVGEGINNDSMKLYSAVTMTLGSDAGDAAAKLTVEDGATLIGYYYGIVGNGNRHNTDIVINGGTVKGTAVNDCAGIYHPQKGNLTINGGVIEGAVGIYVKSGSVTTTVNGGQIVANGEKKTYDPNRANDGFLATGDAAVFDNCDYPGGTPEAVIQGGKFSSKNGAAVASYAKTGQTPISGFITGGLYSSDVSNYVADGYVCVENTDIKTSEDYPFIVTVAPTKVEVAEEVAEIQEDTDDVAEGITPELAGQVKQDVVKDIIENAAETSDSNIQEMIKEGTVLASDTELHKTKVVELDENTKTRIDVKLESLQVDIGIKNAQPAIVADCTVTTTTATYDVKPVVIVTTTDTQTGATEVKTLVITNEWLKDNNKVLTFTLPVPASLDGDSVLVTHIKENGDKEIFMAKVEGSAGARYITIEATEFSHYELSSQKTEVNAVAEIVKDKVQKTYYYTSLANAVSNVQPGETIKLLKDVASGTDIEVKSPITFTIDKNGHTNNVAIKAGQGLKMTTTVASNTNITTYTFEKDDGHEWPEWPEIDEKVIGGVIVGAAVVGGVIIGAKLIKHAMANAVVASVPVMPLVQLGDEGDAVRTLQTKLNDLGYDCGEADGVFGNVTYTAVAAFQKDHGVAVSGIAGRMTWEKLGYSCLTDEQAPDTVCETVDKAMPMLGLGSTEEEVKTLQKKLNALGYDCGEADGVFGQNTLNAVIAFQTANGLTADGMVGAQTWAALL